MSSQQLRVNGTLIDLSQTQSSADREPTLARRLTRSTVLQRNELQGFGMDLGRQSDFASSSTPAHYSPADQFFSGMERLAALPDEVVADMFIESLDRFPRAGSRQMLYSRVLQRLETRLSWVEDPDMAELIDTQSDPEATMLFLRAIDNLELTQQQSPNYTDEELGLK